MSANNLYQTTWSRLNLSSEKFPVVDTETTVLQGKNCPNSTILGGRILKFTILLPCQERKSAINQTKQPKSKNKNLLHVGRTETLRDQFFLPISYLTSSLKLSCLAYKLKYFSSLNPQTPFRFEIGQQVALSTKL